MKVFSQLVRAQLEQKASDYSGGTAMGLVWINSGTGLAKFDDGSAVRTVVTLDNTQTLTNKTWNGVAISEIYGGTNQTTYTTGDILYASASNTLSKLAKGTNGQFLKIGASIPEWAAVTGTLGVKTKANADSPYTILSTDDLILVDTSGGAVTLNLPASSGGGKVYRVKKTTSDFTAVTVARAGSDTIQDVATGGTSTLLHTQGEEIMIIDATSGVWQVIDRRVPCIWTSYSPTISGFGTTANSSFYWRRTGSSIDIRGSFDSGTLAASAASFTLPSGLVVGSTVVTTRTDLLGLYVTLSTTTADKTIYTGRAGVLHTATGTSTSTIYFAVEAANNIYTQNNATSLNSTDTDTVTVNMSGLAISGWNG